MNYTRKQQSGIHACIADIAKHTGHNTVELRDYLKQQYWGDREGAFSLALDRCQPIDAQLFYEFILSLAMDLGVEYGTWTDDP